MLDLTKIFFITLLISYIGSLQIGPISILVMYTTLKINLRAALKVAFVGVLPEYMYSLVAFFGYSFLSRQPETLHMLQLGVIPLFLVFGIINFRKKDKVSTHIPSTTSNAIRAFTYGITNPLLISFWMLSLIIIGKYVSINSAPQIAAFALATGTGGFLTKITFGLLTLKFREKVFAVFQRFSFNKIIGSLFILVAIIQLIKTLSF